MKGSFVQIIREDLTGLIFLYKPIFLSSPSPIRTPTRAQKFLEKLTTTEVSTSPAKVAARRRRAAMAEANQNTNPNPAPSGGEVPPNVTIYINNLNEKIKLEGTPYLSRMFMQNIIFVFHCL